MRVLAVGCHPDDLEIACGGTLRKYVEQGAEVYTCHVANGNQGHVVIEPEPLAAMRAEEFEEASKIIGAKQTFNLNVGDMLVNSHDPAVMDAMADVVRCTRPDVIITHNDADYMQDHTETSRIVTNGSFCSGLSHRPRSFEPYSSFIPVFFMDTLAGISRSRSRRSWRRSAATGRSWTGCWSMTTLILRTWCAPAPNTAGTSAEPRMPRASGPIPSIREWRQGICCRKQ